MKASSPPYRGRIAPSPTGYLHLGHARTFWVAWERARREGGKVLLRIDDIDGPRCRAEFTAAAIEDLTWAGLIWDEGPDVGGPAAPYRQSERYDRYRAAFLTLLRQGAVYPCYCSRRDILEAARAPHQGEDETIYPGRCRPAFPEAAGSATDWEAFLRETATGRQGRSPCWRFRVPDVEVVAFNDIRCGGRSYVGGRDFGDFVVLRADGIVSYQLACVVDDAAMGITEVVRGEDLLISTARQILLAQALGLVSPKWLHCGLLRDERGERLAKRNAAMSLCELREKGADLVEWRERWREEFQAELA